MRSYSLHTLLYSTQDTSIVAISLYSITSHTITEDTTSHVSLSDSNSARCSSTQGGSYSARSQAGTVRSTASSSSPSCTPSHAQPTRTLPSSDRERSHDTSTSNEAPSLSHLPNRTYTSWSNYDTHTPGFYTKVYRFTHTVVKGHPAIAMPSSIG